MTKRPYIAALGLIGGLLVSTGITCVTNAESVEERLRKSRRVKPPRGRYRSNSLPRAAREELAPAAGTRNPIFGGSNSAQAGTKRFRLPKDSVPYIALGLNTARETGILTDISSGTEYVVGANVSGLQFRGGIRLARKSSPTYWIVGAAFFYGKGTVQVESTSPIAYGTPNPSLVMAAVEPGFGYEFKEADVRVEIRIPVGIRFAQWDSPPGGATLQGRTAFVPGAILYASVDRDDFGVYSTAGISGTTLKPQFGIGTEYRF